MTLNYHHLRYFWAVARRGNLTRASEELNLTPQTVSTQIKDLEAALGERLFNRSGRLLVLTEVGRVVYRYADDIFSIGRELLETLRGQPSGRSPRLLVGVVDIMPKLVVHELLKPALRMEEPVRIVCLEGPADKLLAKLAIHGLDVVLSDTPISSEVRVRAYNHLLGECGVTFMAAGGLAEACREGFPASLDGAPMLLPTNGTVLRRHLDRWFEEVGVHPIVAGEFEDSALIKIFGQAGGGVFTVPSVIEAEVQSQHQVEVVGTSGDIRERFYAISVERKIRHPAVSAICSAARTELFA